MTLGLKKLLALACAAPAVVAPLSAAGPWTSTSKPPSGAPSPARPCGTDKVAAVRQVMVVWEENHSYSSIMGNPQAPEINSLARKCGLATNYRSLTHPSLPNYLEMTSGAAYTSWPWVSDCDAVVGCRTSAPSIFSELSSPRRQWRSYAEGMGSNCGTVSYGEYAARHNPAVYYTNIGAKCRKWDQPMGTPSEGPLRADLVRGPVGALTTVTPDVEHDMHNGTVAQGDAWLRTWLPLVIASPGYRSGHLAVLIVWDEGAGTGDRPSHVPLIVMSASTPAGTRSALPYNDFSVLRTISQLGGVAALGRSATAASLAGPFRL